MRISIHITTLDRHSEVALLLQSLREQTYQDFDLVIIDGSNPRACWESSFVNSILTRMKLEGHGVITERAIVVENCRQRNQAIKADKWNNPLICRVDDDVILARDYLERLVNVIQRGYDMASGVTPAMGVVDFKRDPANIKDRIVNKIEYNEFGDLTLIGDDCGYSYLNIESRKTEDVSLSELQTVYPAHHLRSSFMYKRELHTLSGLKYHTVGRVAFREETEFCLRAAYAGYKMGVDLNAVAWHLVAPSGGCRAPDYAQQVAIGDAAFRNTAKIWFEQKGNPYEVKNG